jgi:hypothetical protein
MDAIPHRKNLSTLVLHNLLYKVVKYTPEVKTFSGYMT